MSYDVPYIPPITPYVLPEQPFDTMIANLGIRMTWMKSHSCPCAWSGPLIGAADIACQTCQGRGIYWDAPSPIFTGLITWVHIARTPDEPGFFSHEKVGVVQRGEPTLTIPYTADSTGTIWTNATVFDAYVEVDAIARYSANLKVGGITAVPYQQGLQIAPTGAVTIYNTVTHQVEPVSGYTVSGASVTLPDTYPVNTAYNVEFQAQPVYVAFDRTSAPHIRPFGDGVNGVAGTATASGVPNNLPRRFRCQTLDLWTRARSVNSTSPQSL